ncbi:two-component regulator propeller domain-containing protein [Gemmatimonas sp.]|uniref:two-component regulator propeller domain-containing protein n=1 Tax=Gemmatimonas sp. TaxID=1962908 RepID=UPI003F720CC3
MPPALFLARLRRMLRAIGLLAACSSVRQATAQSPSVANREYVREAIDPGVGFPDSYIAAIAQTPDGYLWLGTRRGLVRFDGLNTTVYTPQNTPGLPASSINALSVDTRGSLWISTDRGLAVREGNAIRRIAADQIPATTTWKVVRDRGGRVWVSGRFGVRVGDGTRFAPVPHFDRYTYGLVEDRRGRMWMGGRGVLASYAVGDSAPVEWLPARDRRVYDVALDSTDALWLAVREGALQLDISDPLNVRQRTAINTAVGSVRAQVWAIAMASDGDVWLGTDTRGVLRWNGRQLNSVDPADRLYTDPVWWLVKDRRGVMWAGTAGGLARYRRSAFRSYTQGLATTTTWSVRGDRDGTPWAATGDGQLSWFDGTVWHRTFGRDMNSSAPAQWPAPAGGMYLSDSDGRLLLATRNGVQDVTARIGFPSGGALGLFVDGDGALIGPTERGVLRSRNGVVDSLYRDLKLDASAQPRIIIRDRAGRLLASGPYLTILHNGTTRRIGPSDGLTDSVVLALHETAGALWIATADSGLFAMRGDHVYPLSSANSRLLGVNGITDDGKGNLWLTSRSGVLRVAIGDLLRVTQKTRRAVAVRQFDRTDGLPSSDINSDFQSQLFRDAQGRIWLPSYAGPVLLDPSAIVADSIPPQVHIEQIQVDGVSVPVDSIIHPAGHPGRIEVTFAATNALVPGRVRAEYRVIGVDSAWIDAGRRRTLTFGPLTGGMYRLEIRVAGEDGNWHPTVATATLDVPRSLVEQPWFFSLLALLSGAGAFAFTRARLASARARERELSILVAQRTADLEASRADLEVRIAERTDALGRELAERYRLEQRLEGTRRMASLGRLAGGVSHEINNALATVLGFAQLAQLASKHDERVHSDLGEVVRAGRRAANITHQLLAFARQHHTPLVATAVDTLVRENLRSLQQLCAPLDVMLSITDVIPEISADAAQLEQLLVNLVKNARDASPTDGRVVVALEEVVLGAARAVGEQVLPAGPYAVLSVHDAGAGIPAEALTHVFEPFFTTKNVNEGTGLGLAVVQGIVQRHGGAIDVHSVVDEGTTFSAWFPARPAGPIDADVDRDDAGCGETILLAEDDPSIRQFATRMLTENGYRVLDAEDGAAAIALVEKAIEAINLVVTDVMMPNANGLELARLLRTARPELPVVFMTGYAGLDDGSLAELRSMGPVLAKPFTRESLLQTVRRALDTSTDTSATGA